MSKEETPVTSVHIIEKLDKVHCIEKVNHIFNTKCGLRCYRSVSALIRHGSPSRTAAPRQTIRVLDPGRRNKKTALEECWAVWLKFDVQLQICFRLVVARSLSVRPQITNRITAGNDTTVSNPRSVCSSTPPRSLASVKDRPRTILSIYSPEFIGELFTRATSV